MLKSIIATVLFSFSLTSGADILVIGDSHTAGPFGKYLHQNLAAAHPEKMIMVYGHSSSAPVHWMSKFPAKLRGGINHHMGHKGIYLPHPGLPSWQTPQKVLNFTSLLDNPVIHASWKKKIPVKPELDTVVIALGANDRNAVASSTGAKTAEYERRVKVLDKMLKEIEDRGLKCIWIGPPSSIKRSKVIEQTTQEYLEEGIKGRCPLFDGRKFVAKFCDKVHFNCERALPTAREWAQEAAEFITDNL